MDTLIIYDSTGYILFQGSGSVRAPIGIPFIWVDIPTGKQIKYTNGIGVDVSVTPNVAILEDIPLTETQVTDKRMDGIESTLLGLMMAGM